MSEGFDLARYQVSRATQEVELPLAECNNCGKNGLQPSCSDHSSSFAESVTIKIRSLPWMKKNNLIAASLYWDSESNAHWKGEYYLAECLKYVVAEAPWGATSDTFLLSIQDGPLGAALETLVPKAGKGQSLPSVDEVKKE